MTTKLHVPQYGAPIEHAIVRALVAYLGSHGWKPKCATYGEGNDRVRTVRDVLDYVFAVTESCVEFQKKGGGFGNVVLIAGNGDDIVSDWRYDFGDPAGFRALMDTFTKAIDGAPVKFILTFSGAHQGCGCDADRVDGKCMRCGKTFS